MSLVPFSFRLYPSIQLAKDKSTDCLFIFVLYVASKKRTSSKIPAFLSCLVQLKSVLFNLLCIFDPVTETVIVISNPCTPGHRFFVTCLHYLFMVTRLLSKGGNHSCLKDISFLTLIGLGVKS